LLKYFEKVGQRVFDVWIEGILVFEYLDVIQLAGKNFTAYTATFPRVAVNDGYLSIELTPVVQNPFITGIEVFTSSTISNLTKAPTRAPTTAAPVETNSTGRWIEVNATAPITARHEPCFVMVDNAKVGRKAYLVGGRGEKITDVYDPVTRVWTKKRPPPIEIHHIQCVAAQGLLWVMAAWTGPFPYEKNAPNAYVYDPALDLWFSKTALPLSRRRGSAAVIASYDQTKIYVSHGNNGGHEEGNFSTSLGYLDVYDIATDEWTSISNNAPNPRDHAGGTLIQNRICVAGGRNGGEIGWPDVTPTDCYNLETGEWEVEASIPQGRGGSLYGTSCDGNLIVAGGEGNGLTFDRVDVFDGKSWTVIDNLVVARHGTGMAIDCVCNQYHVASGSKGAGSGPEITSHETYFPSGESAACINPFTATPTVAPPIQTPTTNNTAPSPTIIILPPAMAPTVPTGGPPAFNTILINCGGKFNKNLVSDLKGNRFVSTSNSYFRIRRHFSLQGLNISKFLGSGHGRQTYTITEG
jgi:Malectin domain